MSNLVDYARETVTPFLGRGEKLRSVAMFKNRHAFFPWFFIGFITVLIEVFDDKKYFVGITEENAIVVPLDGNLKPLKRQAFSVPLDDVDFIGRRIDVVSTKNSEKLKLQMQFGNKRSSGFDEKEFIAAFEGEA